MNTLTIPLRAWPRSIRGSNGGGGRAVGRLRRISVAIRYHAVVFSVWVGYILRGRLRALFFVTLMSTTGRKIMPPAPARTPPEKATQQEE
jgi:hypothetical protein